MFRERRVSGEDHLSDRLPAESAKDAVPMRSVSPEHLPRRPCLHQYFAHARGRPHRLRIERRAMVPRAIRRENSTLRGQHARWLVEFAISLCFNYTNFIFYH